MNKIIASALLAVAFVAVLFITNPVFAQEDRERELLLKLLEDSQNEQQQFQRQHGLPVSPRLPPIPAVPPMTRYQLPPDPYTPKGVVPRIQLKQRCITTQFGKTCFLSM